MALPPMAYFGVSPTTDVGDVVNVESLVDYAPHSVANFVRLTSGNRRELANGAFREDGYLRGLLLMDRLSADDLDTLVLYVLGSWETVSAERALVVTDERGRYIPILAHVSKPTFDRPSGGYWRTNIAFALSNIRVQSATKTSNYTVTADDRLLNCNTASGSITLSLPAVASVNAYVPYNAIKTSGSNNLVLDPNSTEQIEGASTYTVTANNAFVTYYTDGAAWYVLSRD